MDSECKVVYLLAEIRKILEDEDPQPRPLALLMHCHWALHVDLTRPGTTSDFLQRIDNFIFPYVSGQKAPQEVDEYLLSLDFIYLQSLRDELHSFLNSHGLPTSIC